jgi:hypothetical protein
MGRSEKYGRREQFCTGFKRIVVLFAQEHGRKWAAFPLFAADLVKSDRLLDLLDNDLVSIKPFKNQRILIPNGINHFPQAAMRLMKYFQ